MYYNLSAAVAVFLACICFFGSQVAGQRDDTSNFEEEPYNGPMLRRHWVKLRQFNPSIRGQMSVPVPRAGKRSYLPLIGAPQQQEEFQYPMAEPESESQQNEPELINYPKFLQSVGKSPIYWPTRPYL